MPGAARLHELRLPASGGGTTPPPANTYEAENAAVVGATIQLAGQAGTNPGYQGGGYVGNWGGTGQYVEFTVTVATAATYLLTFRYRNAIPGSATRNLTVDGASSGTVSFSVNASAWEADAWTTATAIVTLSAGAHAVRLTHPGPDFANYLDLDNVAVAVTTTQPPPPPPPPPTGGSVDFAVLFQTFYPPGAGRTYVAVTGNDANPGTQSSPKRTIGAGLAALGGGGGIVWVGDGDYGTNDIQDRNYAANAYALIMSTNWLGARATNTGGNVITFTRCSYLGIYGFEVASNENSSITTQLGISTGYDPGGTSRNLAWWRNHVHHMSQAGLGSAGNNHLTDYIDICYNLVHDTARWFYSAGSNISLYHQVNLNPGDAGYHCNIVGNVCYRAHNEPGTAQTDGNGIIIDDWMHTQSTNVNNTAKCLVMFNLCVNNGGRGVHSPWVESCHHVFNTCALNCWSLEPGSRGGENALGGTGSRGNYNVTRPQPGSGANDATWSSYFVGAYGGSILDNTVLGGSYHGPADTLLRNRTSEGLNYFKNNNPSITPDTLALVDGWRPDGGSGVVEKTTISQGDYNLWSKWPTWFGDYRPNTRLWAHGFAEAT